ncbi:Cof-type HAD-IIB family hydrolase [Paenibacillus sp. LHD-117]|uniref:Cof-type HAD-IIB family hydrolase n=1 Tax=Paenibacillus sp. LHD-117 TaxID=3071412 RepID=UPI0027DEB6D2|nr:Cof-type HAD-IIB family hydrolase [Paenibacillus sp. LHD-117]MDQ6419839.1 Cof-type HAD-IIB family hydrolase [Paenibacillus sp. LHD-117]
MSDYKLLALDMDGTLLNELSEISGENAEWIQKALDIGVIVSFSTGRGFESALPYAEQLKLETPMITVNGGEVWARPHVLHKRTELSPIYVKRLHELAGQYPEVWFWAYTTQTVYNKERWFDASRDYDSFHWLKFGYYTEDDRAREAILAETQSWEAFEITNSSPHNIELNPLGVSKASALRELCGLLGIEMSQVIAAGDSLNDIAAIREAGLGVAMGNAQEAVKLAADAVTLTNDENGVAEIIKKYIFGT